MRENDEILRNLDIQDQENPDEVPALLKRLPGKDRLAFIRREDSGATEFGNVAEPKFKYINYIIFCDIYLEHLRASLSSISIFGPEENYTSLTEQKIRAVEDARAILENGPESEETMHEFSNKLHDNQALLETRRDTQFTSFLKSVGLMWLVDLAYSSFFVKTDGTVLIEKIEADKNQP